MSPARCYELVRLFGESWVDMLRTFRCATQLVDGGWVRCQS